MDGFIATLLITVVLVLCVVVAKSHYRKELIKQAVAAHLSGREPLTPKEFAESFFSVAQQPIAEFVIEAFQRSLIFDTARIRPDDRLIADLRLGQIDGLEPNEIDAAIKKRFGCSMVPSFAENDPSVRELVDFVAKAA
jgi:acyl carrier protein